MKHIIASMAVMAAGSMIGSAYAATVNSLDKIGIGAIYYLTRVADEGAGLLHAEEGQELLKATPAGRGITNADPNARWAIHYSHAEDAYFLYNLGTGKFASANSRCQAIVSDVPVDVVLSYQPEPKYWLIDCGGYTLGVDRESDGKALFVDDVPDRPTAKALGYYFAINSVDNEFLNQAQLDEINAKIAAGREAAIKKYSDFVVTAEKMANVTNENLKKMTGLYDLDELKYALANPEKFNLREFEEIYQRTLLTRYPKGGKYYRLHNNKRPAAAFYKNALLTTESGNLVSREFTDFGYGKATEGNSDDLGLIRLWPAEGDPTRARIELAAFGLFLTETGNNQKPKTTLNFNEATFYGMGTKTTTGRTFNFAQPDNAMWLTVSGDGNMVGWNKNEDATYFYLEEVKTIDIPVDANGYASVMLPCGVRLPEGCKAYTVTDVAGGKAFVEEITNPLIHYRTPFILKAPAGSASVALTVENNLNWIHTEMAGNMIVNNQTPGRYVPEYSASGITFKYVAATEPAEKTLPGHIYIVSEDNGPLTTVMGANPEAGIDEITADEAARRDLYDLQGRPVKGTPRTGIYINAATKQAIRVK